LAPFYSLGGDMSQLGVVLSYTPAQTPTESILSIYPQSGHDSLTELWNRRHTGYCVVFAPVQFCGIV